MHKKNFYLSFVFSLLIFSVFTWPLTKHVTKGIPASAHNQEKDNIRYMIAGDHLQLFYRYWLLGDMIKGKTPFFTNLYEFNTGNDVLRYKFAFYYIPFSLVFVIINFFASKAFAWNGAAFFSIFITYYFSVHLALKYTKATPVAFLCALFGILIPFRWISLLGGSPTGFATAFIPIIFLGIENVFSERSIKGGFLAGIAVFFAYCSDAHVFFFSVLSLPVISMISFLKNSDYFFNDKTETFFKKTVKTLLNISPVILFTVISMFLSFLLKKRLESSMMKEGRTLKELALFSPKWQGLFFNDISELSSHVFIGLCFIFIIVTGSIILFINFKKNKKEYYKHVYLYFFLLSVITVIIFLSLGMNGPHNGFFIRFFRKVISPYSMIRQSAKIFSILPFFMIILSTIMLNQIFCFLKNKVSKIYFLLGIFVFMFAEYKNQIKTAVCLLPKSESTYEAVSHQSLKDGKKSHVLILPLWPGDSAWSSIYEYYVSLYRIRMVNGYSPIIPIKYINEIFHNFKNMNKGSFKPIQAENLKQKGINHIILHEDAFPEKVSPYPVCFTLKRLLENPCLELLPNEISPVWAFKIVENNKNIISPNWNTFFPVHSYEFENCKYQNALKKEHEAASSKAYLELKEKGGFAVTKDFSIPDTKDQKWGLRLKGKGKINIYLRGSLNNSISTIIILNEEWHYITLPLNEISEERTSIKIELIEGKVDIDYACFMSGDWDFNNSPSEIILNAPLFFHAGYTKLKTDSVTMQKNKVNAVPFKLDSESALKLNGHRYSALYGPNLPLSKGKYKITFDFTSKVKNKELLGYVYFTFDNKNDSFMKILAGEKAEQTIEVKNNLPFILNFIYSGDYDIEINRVIIKKTDSLV